jgi:hypothetical protein
MSLVLISGRIIGTCLTPSFPMIPGGYLAMAKKGAGRFADRMRILEKQLRQYRYWFKHPLHRKHLMDSWRRIFKKIYGRRS